MNLETVQVASYTVIPYGYFTSWLVKINVMMAINVSPAKLPKYLHTNWVNHISINNCTVYVEDCNV